MTTTPPRSLNILGYFTALLLGLAMLAGPAHAAPFAYISNSGSNNVSVFDTATNTVVATVSVGTGPTGVAVNPPAGTRVYVTNSGSNNVSVIDTATNTVIATVAVGTYPVGVVLNPAGTRVYVTNSGSNNVSVIDTAANTVVATVAVGSGPVGVVFTPAGTRAYVANLVSNNVSVIDTATNTVIATVSVGANPTDVVFNPAGTRAYVTNHNSNNVSVIDTATNTVVATVAVGTNPQGIVFNSVGTRAYVANTGSDTVSVIDTATNTVVATVAVGTNPVAFVLFIGPATVTDATPPSIAITSPVASGQTYSTSTGTVNVSGTASDNVGVVSVVWSNDRGGGGTASGTTSWSATGIALQSGFNTITVRAYDAAGNNNLTSIIVNYTLTDTTPDAFSFTSQTGVALNTVVTSNTITVSGINAAAPISITGGSYSENGAAYTTGSGTVNNGNTVSVRLTSSGSNSTMTCATLTIGGVSGSFCATTLPVAQPTGDYTGAWYNANESGWGLSIIHGPLSGLYGIIMYHYNQSASPTWYWMSGGSFSGNTYSVPVSLYSGPYFGGPFNPALVTSSVVGSATINFTSATTATISYTISGITVTKNIAKLDF